MTPSIGDGWSEAAFERGTYGPDDREGLAARFETADASVSVLPVRYERDGAIVEIEGLTAAVGMDGPAPDAFGPRVVDRRTAFAVVAGEGVGNESGGNGSEASESGTSEAADAESSTVYTLAADADDALAVACWLTAAAEDARDLRECDRYHRGAQPTSGGVHALSDDERLHATLAETTERCLFTGKPTGSHAVQLPLRYAAALGGYPENDAGLPAVPTAVERFEAAVSHQAWTEHGVGELALDAPVERARSGEYGLDDPTVAALATGDAEQLRLVRPGAE